MSLPFAQIDTVFFDVGNTLLSIDFDWVSEELSQRGVRATPEALRRAEAAVRPAVSAGIVNRVEKESQETFTFYLGLILRQLGAASEIGRPMRTIPQPIPNSLGPCSLSDVVDRRSRDRGNHRLIGGLASPLARARA